MMDEEAISLLLKEHSYSKKRRIYSIEDLNSKTIYLFNECEYSVCALLDYNAQNQSTQQISNCTVQVTIEDLNVAGTGYPFEGFVHFKKTYYMKAYQALSNFTNQDSNYEPCAIDLSELDSNQNEIYSGIFSIVNSFFLGADTILREKNTTEYKMRKYRLTAELHAYELAMFILNVYYNLFEYFDWMSEISFKYFTDYQLHCYIELLTIMIPTNNLFLNLLQIDTESDSFEKMYNRKVFGSSITELFEKLTQIWIPNIEPVVLANSNKALSSNNDKTSNTVNEIVSQKNPSNDNLDKTKNNSEIAILIIPPLPCIVYESDDASPKSLFSNANLNQSERISIFEKYFKGAKFLDYKIKLLEKKDYNDEMIHWWINDLGCTIQRRITHFKKNEPNTPIYLVGWITGASLAYKIFLALLDHISGVVLINMPTNNGNLGFEKNLDTKLLYRSLNPIIFVASSESELCNFNELQEIRASMSHQTSLIYANHCDDFLFMGSQGKKRLILTQDIIDLNIIEAIRKVIFDEIANAEAIANSKLLAVNKKSNAGVKNHVAINQKNPSSNHTTTITTSTNTNNSNIAYNSENLPINPVSNIVAPVTTVKSPIVLNTNNQNLQAHTTIKPTNLTNSLNPSMSFIEANSVRTYTKKLNSNSNHVLPSFSVTDSKILFPSEQPFIISNSRIIKMEHTSKQDLSLLDNNLKITNKGCKKD